MQEILNVPVISNSATVICMTDASRYYWPLPLGGGGEGEGWTPMLKGRGFSWENLNELCKGPFTQAISVAATRCNFCRAKVATSKSHV